ncbi:MAG: threonine/serine dehydratase, partial [Anaerorhabdus sp.]
MNIEKIMDAKRVLEGVVETTPLIDASLICKDLWIKAENLQKTGSFKVRGATYKISRLTAEERKQGVIAASAGNHAQGVASACQKSGIDGVIIMPLTAPLSKVESTKNYGVEVRLVGETFQDAYLHAKELAEQERRVFIEPYDDEDVIAGQGTIGLEILEKLLDVDVVFVPIGGGGLAAGVSCAIKTLRPQCKIIGVQAEGASSMKKSFDLGTVVSSDAFTMADGLAVKQAGEKTLSCCLDFLDEVITVTDQEIAATMLILLEKMKLV